MQAQASKPRRARVHRTAQFKSQLIKLALEPGASVAGVAIEHGVNPDLLGRWIREIGGVCSPPAFLPVRLEPANRVQPTAVPANEPIQINLERGDIHIQLKVDSRQITELGQLLHQVLQ